MLSWPDEIVSGPDRIVTEADQVRFLSDLRGVYFEFDFYLCTICSEMCLLPVIDDALVPAVQFLYLLSNLLFISLLSFKLGIITAYFQFLVCF